MFDRFKEGIPLVRFINLTFNFASAQPPDTLWTRTYGGSFDDIGYSVQQTSDGGYIVVGRTESSFGAGGYDLYLIKNGPEVGIEEKTSNRLSNIQTPGYVHGDLLKLIGISRHTKIKVLDALGREVLRQDVSPQKSHINLTNLKSGVYFILINERKQKLHKFVLIR